MWTELIRVVSGRGNSKYKGPEIEVSVQMEKSEGRVKGDDFGEAYRGSNFVAAIGHCKKFEIYSIYNENPLEVVEQWSDLIRIFSLCTQLSGDSP